MYSGQKLKFLPFLGEHLVLVSSTWPTFAPSKMHHEFHQIWCGVEFKSRFSSKAWDDSTLTTLQGFAIDEANGQGVKYGEKDGNFHRNIAATDWKPETKSSELLYIDALHIRR